MLIGYATRLKRVSHMKNLNQLKKQERKLGAKIALAHKSKSASKMHDAYRAYLNSFAAKFVACQVTRKKRDKIPVRTLAEQLNVWEPCNEKVILHPVLKASSFDYRWILNFFWENRARQMLLRKALLYQFKTHPEQFMMNGGRDKAIRELVAIYEQGFHHVIDLDVYHCFKSFDVLGVSKFLMLPKEVCRNVLSGANLNIFLSKSYGINFGYDQSTSDGLTPIQEIEAVDLDWSAARQGLTEGSLVSPFACELLLTWVVERLPKEKGHLINYADNFLFMCKSENDAKELHIILRKLLSEHPAGPLHVKSVYNSIKLGSSFEFLGYWIEPIGETVSIHWSERARRKSKNQRANVYAILRGNLSSEQKAKAVNDLFKKQRDLLAGFNEWPGGQAYLRKKMKKLVSKAEENGVPPHMLTAKLTKFIG